jgi:hypothetical protein
MSDARHQLSDENLQVKKRTFKQSALVFLPKEAFDIVDVANSSLNPTFSVSTKSLFNSCTKDRYRKQRRYSPR